MEHSRSVPISPFHQAVGHSASPAHLVGTQGDGVLEVLRHCCTCRHVRGIIRGFTDRRGDFEGDEHCTGSQVLATKGERAKDDKETVRGKAKTTTKNDSKDGYAASRVPRDGEGPFLTCAARLMTRSSSSSEKQSEHAQTTFAAAQPVVSCTPAPPPPLS